MKIIILEVKTLACRTTMNDRFIFMHGVGVEPRFGFGLEHQGLDRHVTMTKVGQEQ